MIEKNQIPSNIDRIQRRLSKIATKASIYYSPEEDAFALFTGFRNILRKILKHKYRELLKIGQEARELLEQLDKFKN